MLLLPLLSLFSRLFLSSLGSRVHFRFRCGQRAAQRLVACDVAASSWPNSASSSSGVSVQLSGVVSAGFSFSPERLSEADSMSLDKWGE